MSARLVEVDELAPVADTGAPIVLVTGLPGSGKSLFSLAEFAVGKVGVYQAGIPGCDLPAWEPERWQELPPDSTLIVDEAQDFFPPTSPTGTPPAHYVLNKIRHKGISLVLMTQHPNMIDSRVRRLVGRHVHVVRNFGKESAFLYEWRRVGDVDSSSREGATRKGWQYPKEVYKLYKSSDRHREMQKAPFKVRAVPYIWGGALALMLAGGWWVFRHGQSLTSGQLAAQSTLRAGGDSNRSVRGGDSSSERARSLTPAEYAESFKPRVAGLDYTAPRYDGVTKPVRAPVPAACIANADKCSCYSQQATPLQVGDAMCRQIVAGGYFKDFDDGDDQKRDGAGAAGTRAAAVPAGSVPVGGDVGAAAFAAPGQAGSRVAALSGGGPVVVGGTYGPGR